MKTQDAGYLAMKAQTELKVPTMPHNMAFTCLSCSLLLTSNACLITKADASNLALHHKLEPVMLKRSCNCDLVAQTHADTGQQALSVRLRVHESQQDMRHKLACLKTWS